MLWTLPIADPGKVESREVRVRPIRWPSQGSHRGNPGRRAGRLRPKFGPERIPRSGERRVRGKKKDGPAARLQRDRSSGPEGEADDSRRTAGRDSPLPPADPGYGKPPLSRLDTKAGGIDRRPAGAVLGDHHRRRTAQGRCPSEGSARSFPLRRNVMGRQGEGRRGFAIIGRSGRGTRDIPGEFRLELSGLDPGIPSAARSPHQDLSSVAAGPLFFRVPPDRRASSSSASS